MVDLLANRVHVDCSTSGTGNLTVGAAISTAYQNFTTAGITNGATFPYTAYTSTQFECGHGTYVSATPAVARTTPHVGSSATPVNFSSAPRVFIGPLAEDWPRNAAIAFSALAAAEAATIPASVGVITTLGYYTDGDQGGGTYRRVAAEPYHHLWFQSGDGAYWEYVPGPEGINAKVAGLKGNIVTDDRLAFEKVNRFMKLYGRSRKYTVTVSSATPAVVTCTAHGFHFNECLWFTSTGTLPTGITAGRPYFVRGTGLLKDSFQISERQAYVGADPFDATGDGERAAVNTSSTGSGTHSVQLSGIDPIILIIPPGIYNTAANFYLAGTAWVRNLHVKAHGAEFITTAEGGGSAGYNVGGGTIGILPSHTFADSREQYAKIDNAGGDPNENTFVVLATLADVSKFIVNQWVHIGAIDLQNAWGIETSWPPNNQVQEFAKIWAINTGTGQIDFQSRIKLRYMDHYPEPFTGSATAPSGGGPAMIRPISVNWDIEVVVEGAHFMSTSAGSQQIGSGRKMVYRNCVFEVMDFLPQASHNREIYFEDCHFRAAATRLLNQSIEIDKQVETLSFTGCDMGHVDIQSTSVEKLIVDKCDIDWLQGTVKSTYIRDSSIARLYIGPNSLGYTESFVVHNSCVSYIIDNTASTQGVVSFTGLVEDYTFTSGVLSIPMSANKGRTWMVPGKLCYVTNLSDPASSNIIYTSMGSAFTVIDIWQDGSNNFCVQTDLAAKPVGSSTNSTVTISVASPAVVTWASHGLIAATPIVFKTTGTLPTGLSLNTAYYVIATGLAAGSFQISSSIGGAAVNTTGVGSGTHTAVANPLFYVPHPLQHVTVRGCTGSARIVELSHAPSGLPWLSYSHRAYSGDQSGNQAQYHQETHPQGKVVKIVIDVVRPYTGGNASFTQATLSGEAFNSSLVRSDLILIINPLIAGKRVITQDSVTGAQTGDTLAPTSVWLGRQTTLVYNSSAGTVDVAPLIDVEILTDQKSGADLSIYVSQRPGATGNAEMRAYSGVVIY